MNRIGRLLIGSSLLMALIAMITPPAESAPPRSVSPTAALLVTGLQGATGSTVGPDGALYVTEGAAGRISRVDPQTGELTTFASGLPKAIPAVGIGGAIDVAFIGKTAYVLVTLVDHDVGGSDVDGIYRVDGPDSFTIVADIGDFNINNPPTIPFPFFIPTGVQYALQTFRGGFLVTDGHLNRVLRVTLDGERRRDQRVDCDGEISVGERRRDQRVDCDGEISVLIAFDDIVPTGLAVSGNTIYMAEAGPVPHLAQNGKVVAFGPKSTTATEVASGAPLLVDVEFGRGRSLYALSQGPGVPGAPPGSPAQPNSGALVKVNGDGTLTMITDHLNLPTSARVHRDHRIRRHPHRGGLEDRRRLGTALRCVALSNTATAPPAGRRPRTSSRPAEGLQEMRCCGTDDQACDRAGLSWSTCRALEPR